jgi:hypothetical protein
VPKLSILTMKLNYEGECLAGLREIRLDNDFRQQCRTRNMPVWIPNWFQTMAVRDYDSTCA